MITPYIRENIEYCSTISRYEVIDYNSLGYLHVVFASDVKELCENYINTLNPPKPQKPKTPKPHIEL
jgi:hypothetical protein